MCVRAWGEGERESATSIFCVWLFHSLLVSSFLKVWVNFHPQCMGRKFYSDICWRLMNKSSLRERLHFVSHGACCCWVVVVFFFGGGLMPPFLGWGAGLWWVDRYGLPQDIGTPKLTSVVHDPPHCRPQAPPPRQAVVQFSSRSSSSHHPPNRSRTSPCFANPLCRPKPPHVAPIHKPRNVRQVRDGRSELSTVSDGSATVVWGLVVYEAK